MLAFTLSPGLWGFVVLVASLCSSLVTAYLHAKKHDREAKIALAAFSGVKKGLQDAAAGQDVVTAIEDGIREAAQSLGVAEHVEEHIGDGLGGKA